MANKSSPIVVLIDIETSPITAYTWETYDTNVLKVIEPSKVISVAWKELYDKEVQVRCIADYKKYKSGVVDDKSLIEDTWKVLDRADVVIAHNGAAFDIKRLNARFIAYGLSSPSAYAIIDTLKSAKKHFKFDSNSLNNLGVYLGLGEKVENGGFGLWIKCMAGDKDAWERMKVYNQRDVDLLEQVYLKLRPFMTDHPNLNTINPENITHSDGTTCPSCLSTNISKRGFSFTKTGRKQRYQCGDCGSWSTGGYQRFTAAVSEED